MIWRLHASKVSSYSSSSHAACSAHCATIKIKHKQTRWHKFSDYPWARTLLAIQDKPLSSHWFVQTRASVNRLRSSLGITNNTSNYFGMRTRLISAMALIIVVFIDCDDLSFCFVFFFAVPVCPKPRKKVLVSGLDRFLVRLCSWRVCADNFTGYGMLWRAIIYGPAIGYIWTLILRSSVLRVTWRKRDHIFCLYQNSGHISSRFQSMQTATSIVKAARSHQFSWPIF